jgi:hypothetical protein
MARKPVHFLASTRRLPFGLESVSLEPTKSESDALSQQDPMDQDLFQRKCWSIRLERAVSQMPPPI